MPTDNFIEEQSGLNPDFASPTGFASTRTVTIRPEAAAAAQANANAQEAYQEAMAMEQQRKEAEARLATLPVVQQLAVQRFLEARQENEIKHQETKTRLDLQQRESGKRIETTAERLKIAQADAQRRASDAVQKLAIESGDAAYWQKHFELSDAGLSPVEIRNKIGLPSRITDARLRTLNPSAGQSPESVIAKNEFQTAADVYKSAQIKALGAYGSQGSNMVAQAKAPYEAAASNYLARARSVPIPAAQANPASPVAEAPAVQAPAAQVPAGTNATPEKMVLMTNPKGQRVNVPESAVAKAKKAGYR